MKLKNIIQSSIGFYLNITAYLAPKYTARFGFDLFCHPFAKKLKPHQQSYLESAKHILLDYQGKNIQTYTWGSGSKNILLIHGWASHSYRWKSYIERLIQNDYTVYAIDAAGHGLSEGKYLTLLVYCELIEKYTADLGPLDAIIGHSIGGYAVLYYLHLHPELYTVKSVIMGAPGEVADFFDFYQKSLGLNRKAMQLIGDEFITRIGKRPSDFSAPLLAQNIENPCLIIHDKQDKDTDYNYSVKLHAAWKNSILKLTDGLGHGLKSKELEIKVLDFIAS
jgi:pimeloyl-ACP methyl ester carboxylesterase